MLKVPHNCTHSDVSKVMLKILQARLQQYMNRELAASDCVDHNKLWKILKEMGKPDHLTCILRNLYAGQEATVRTECGTTDRSQISKGVHQGCILSPCLLIYMQSTSLETLDWKKHKLESRLLGEISISSDMQMTPPLWQRVKRNSKAS